MLISRGAMRFAHVCRCCCRGQGVGMSADYIGADVTKIAVEVNVLSGKRVWIMPLQDYSVRVDGRDMEREAASHPRLHPCVCTGAWCASTFPTMPTARASWRHSW